MIALNTREIVMSQWKDAFSKGIASFRGQQYEQALASFSEVSRSDSCKIRTLIIAQAISLGSNEASVYDSRAAVYEKLGKRKEALLDSKQVIYLAPDLWKVRIHVATVVYYAHCMLIGLRTLGAIIPLGA